MAATIKDVAKKANVSISTVSRVLSNQMHVSSSTYKRIQDAVAELNYIPNSSAVSLVKKSSTTVLYADSFYKGRPYENPHMFDIISGSSHEVFHSLDEVCHQFDLGTPIWLDLNISDFRRHNKTRFTQDSFVESIDFDYLEIQVIEED